MTRHFLAFLLLNAAATIRATYQRIHSEYTSASVRLKSFDGTETDLCDSRHPHHVGWADLDNGHHLFYWFHEARHRPKEAPLIVWLQGGPGASSMLGQFLEHGPCLVSNGASTEYNPNSWTEAFNVIYMDSPADAGFSYHDDLSASLANTTGKTAMEVVDAIELLYEAFPHLERLPLHIAGESYGGLWVPATGDAILARNKQRRGRPSIPLRSLMVGNGWTDPVVQTPSLVDVGCHAYHGFKPYLSSEICADIFSHLESCKAALRGCAETRNPEGCAATYPACKDHIFDPALESYGSNPYDRRMRGCTGDCYQPMYEQLKQYLARPQILDEYLELAIATNGRKTAWASQDVDAPPRFFATGDHFISVIPQLERVLAQPGVDVLYYAGVADVSCNPKGILEALEGARWENQISLVRAEWNDLPCNTTRGCVAGRAKRLEGLWMVEVFEAGHLVPMDQAVVALQLATEWRSYTESADDLAGGGRLIGNFEEL